jgi:hypothetical protein
VWEVRVVVGFDPARARSIQRSFTVHGDTDRRPGGPILSGDGIGSELG